MQDVPKHHETTNYRQRLYDFSCRYRALLHNAGPVPSQGVPAFLQELSKLLHGVFEFKFVSYSLADPSLNVLQLYILDTDGPDLLENPLELA